VGDPAGREFAACQSTWILDAAILALKCGCGAILADGPAHAAVTVSPDSEIQVIDPSSNSSAAGSAARNNTTLAINFLTGRAAVDSEFSARAINARKAFRATFGNGTSLGQRVSAPQRRAGDGSCTDPGKRGGKAGAKRSDNTLWSQH
jgi:hypothetical protein